MIQVTQFKNRIKVYIHGPNIEVEDADMSFITTFTDEKEPNLCTLKIYNLNEANMDAVLNNTKYIEIFTNQYGIKNTDGTILWQGAFAGIPKSTEEVKTLKSGKTNTKHNTPSINANVEEGDYYIQFDIQEGDGRDIGKFVSKSYRAGFDVKKIITDVAKSIDLEPVFDKNIKNFKLTYPIILHENVRDSLVKLASYIDATCTFNNGRVYVVGNNPNGLTTYFHFDESNIPQPKFLQNNKIEFVAPYISTLNVGTFVKLTNRKKHIDGIYQICKIENAFSNYSEDCESKITVKTR